MNLFCKYTTCTECGVAFKPVTGDYADYCSIHRKPKLEALARKNCLLEWAEARLDEVEKLYLADMEKYRSSQEALRQAQFNQQYSQMAASQMQSLAQSGLQNPWPYGGK